MLVNKIIKTSFGAVFVFYFLFLVFNYIEAGKPYVKAPYIFYTGDDYVDVESTIDDFGGASQVQAWFEWMVSGFPWESTTSQTIPDVGGDNKEVYTETISIFSNIGTYYIRSVVSNPDGTDYSAIITFYTKHSPFPAAVASDASGDESLDNGSVECVPLDSSGSSGQGIVSFWECDKGVAGMTAGGWKVCSVPTICDNEIDFETFQCTLTVTDDWSISSRDTATITINNTYKECTPDITAVDVVEITWCDATVLGELSNCSFNNYLWLEAAPTPSFEPEEIKEGDVGGRDIPMGSFSGDFKGAGEKAPLEQDTTYYTRVAGRPQAGNRSNPWPHPDCPQRVYSNVIGFTTSSVNVPPNADAGDDVAIDEGTTTTLNGSGYDPDDCSYVNYSWSCNGGTLSDPNVKRPDYTAPYVNQDIDYECTLTVEENSTLVSNLDTVIITVKNTNNPPTADPDGPYFVNEWDTSIHEFGTITLDGSNSDPNDSGETITSWLWSCDGTGITLTNPNTVNPTLEVTSYIDSDTIHNCTLEVTDSGGLTNSATTTVEIINNVHLPDVKTTGTSNITTTSVILRGQLDSLGGFNTNNVWFEWRLKDSSDPYVRIDTDVPIDGTIAESDPDPKTFTANLTGLTPDEWYEFRAVAQNNEGFDRGLPNLIFKTNAVVSNPPTSDPGGPYTVNEWNKTADPQEFGKITLDGSNSDPNDSGETITSWLWSCDGMGITLTNPNTVNPTLEVTSYIDSDTIHNCTLEVTDSGGLVSEEASTTVTVINNVEPPQVSTTGTSNVTTNSAILEGNLDSLGNFNSNNVWFEWRKIGDIEYQDVPPTHILMNSTGAFSTDLTGLTPDEWYEFRAVAQNNEGFDRGLPNLIFKTDAVVNNPPTADPDGPYFVNEWDTSIHEFGKITLDGSNSDPNDSGDSIVSWLWTCGGTGITLTNPDTVNPTLEVTAYIDSNTTHNCTLEVTDSGGLTDSATTTVEIINNVSSPQVETTGFDNITTNSATLDGTLVNLGGFNTNNVWFEWRKIGDIEYQDVPPTHILMNSTGAFSTDLTGLTPDEWYEFRAVAQNNEGFDRGLPNLIFKTSVLVNDPPTVNAGPDKTIDENTSVQLEGSGTDPNSGDTLTYSWSCNGGTLSNPNIAQPNFTALYVSSDTNYTCTLIVTDNHGASAIDDMIVNVINITGPPQVQTNDANNITSNSADLNGALLAFGGFTSANVWFEWGLTVSYGNETIHYVKDVLGVIDQNLPGLLANTTYHFRAVAENNEGIVYGGNKSFTTSIIINDSPTADAGDDETIDEATTIGLDGSDSSDSDGIITDYSWFCNGGTLSNPNIAQPNFTAPYVSSDTNYTCTLTVTDNGGLSDSDDAVITVLNKTGLPDIETNNATNILSGSAVLHGILLNLGGFTSANVWFEWGLTVSYGNETTHYVRDFLGVIDQNLPGLLANTTYHFRAVAQNNEGIVYGGNKFFTTSDSPLENDPPTANAGPDKTIDENTSVQLEGSGTDPNSGDTLTYSWSCNGGTLSNPNIAQPNFTAPYVSSDTNYTCILTVIDNHGANDSDDMIVNVINITGPPQVQTNDADNIGDNSAALHGTLLDLGGFTSANVWFEWGLSVSYGNETIHYVKDVLGVIDQNLPGLLANTTYHFRAVAENNEGISYGDNMSFITSEEIPNNEPVVKETWVTFGHSCCETSFSAYFSWEYFDFDDYPDPQSAYWIQISEKSDFSDCRDNLSENSFDYPDCIDSGKVATITDPPSDTYATTELIPKAKNSPKKYYWRVKVWDTSGPAESEWWSIEQCNGEYLHPCPDFEWSCERGTAVPSCDVQIGETVIFTDKSRCDDINCDINNWLYGWNFEGGDPSYHQFYEPIEEYPMDKPPPVLFSIEKPEVILMLIYSEPFGFFECEITKELSVIFPPGWKETPPFSWMAQSLAALLSFFEFLE